MEMVNGRFVVAADDLVHGDEPWAIDLGAVSEPVGLGTGAAIVPSLRASDPILGSTMQIAGSGAEANTLAYLCLGTAAGQYAAIGHLWFVTDLQVIAFAQPVGDGFGFSLPIPNLAVLDGIEFALQAIVGPTAGPSGASTTNGVYATIGS
jgi:hypothetical protein